MELKSIDRMGASDVASGQRPSRARLLAALPRLSSTTAALRNRAYETAPCMLTGDRILIWQDSGPLKVIGEMSCRMADTMLALAVDSLSHIEPRLEGFESFVPTETCTALVEHALSPLLSLLERLAGVPIECDGYKRGPPAEADGVSIGFALFESSLRPVLRGCVRMGHDAWQALDFSRAVTLDARRHLVVPIRLSIELGRCRLSASELAQLALGDALRPDQRIASDATGLPVTLVNSSGRLSYLARVSGNELTLENSVNADVTTSAATLADQDAAPSDAGSNDMLSDVECDLTFELGSMRLTVADIAKLRAGLTMRLGVRLQEQPIRLLVNGRLIARGELAAIGDELVVVVTDTSRLPHV
jgi:type III secretion system YscQ/HrcQ family protein